MFIDILFLIVPNGKKPKWPPTDEWTLSKSWYIYSIDYYSASKSNKLLIPGTTQINFKRIVAKYKKPDPGIYAERIHLQPILKSVYYHYNIVIQ